MQTAFESLPYRRRFFHSFEEAWRTEKIPVSVFQLAGMKLNSALPDAKAIVPMDIALSVYGDLFVLWKKFRPCLSITVHRPVVPIKPPPEHSPAFVVQILFTDDALDIHFKVHHTNCIMYKSWKFVPFWEVFHILKFKTDLFRNFPQPARFHVANPSQQWDLYHVYAYSYLTARFHRCKSDSPQIPLLPRCTFPASFTYRRYRRSTQPTVQLSLFRTNLFNWSVLLAHSHAGYHDCSGKYTR